MYEGKLVRLRAMEPEDAEKHFLMVNDYQIARGLTSGMLYPSTRADEQRYVGDQSSYTRGEYQFAIETLEDGAFIGRCGFIRVDWRSRVAELGVMIGERAMQGKGYGADAVSVLSQFGFQELNLHKLKAQVFAFNKAAIACYSKCGFTAEGTLRQEIYREGAYHDIVVMGLIRASGER